MKITKERADAIATWMWIIAGAIVIASGIYQIVGTYQSTQAAKVMIAGIEARDRKNAADFRVTLLRWQKVVKHTERDLLLKPQGKDIQ